MKYLGLVFSIVAALCLLTGLADALEQAAQPAAPRQPAAPDPFLDAVAADTWTYFGWATTNHLPWSWRSPTVTNTGDFANPAEIGLYALTWLAAYDLRRPWSPAWPAVEAEITAVLTQLRAWQTGSQSQQPHGPNAYANSVFYQWYWIGWNPPVVSANPADHLVPSVDNAWLAASLITIRAYANAHGHAALAQQADAILADMDFRLWFDPATGLFTWGDVENPAGGLIADYYSNENRIINFVARALGDLNRAEYRHSLGVMTQLSGTYQGITVAKMAFDGSYFTYAAPALFIREAQSAYGSATLMPATQAQIAYAADAGYVAWGLSDCYDVGLGGYVQQGAPPAALIPPETRPGLVTPHASALALITPLAAEARVNLQTISTTFACAYAPGYGFYDSVMADPAAADYGQCSIRFSSLAQAWIFLAIANHETGFVWRYFYRDPGVRLAHAEMFDEWRLLLPAVPHATPTN